MTALVCPDCGRERGEHGCRHWMDCMNNMRHQLRDNKVALAERDKRIAELETRIESTAARLRGIAEGRYWNHREAALHALNCLGFPPNQQPKEE